MDLLQSSFEFLIERFFHPGMLQPAVESFLDRSVTHGEESVEQSRKCSEVLKHHSDDNTPVMKVAPSQHDRGHRSVGSRGLRNET